MKREIAVPGMIFIFLYWFAPPAYYGPTKSGHFKYRFISYEIIDSAKVNADIVTSK